MADGATIAGRYRIERRLGVGGMATVQLAFDERLERYVAIKLLAEHLADDPAFVSRFRREALSAARLVHPNIVQVFDFGFDERQHQHFIVMEHVPGQSCAELLRDRGRFGVEEGVEILAQACRGLDYAHRNGVVHRDVKPGNLLLSDSQVVKLADFGIARATDQSSITQVGSVLGTAAYLAPEQARGEEAGPRADLYSLGVVAYQLLSGRLPYEANSLSELALKQQRESPPPLDHLNPAVPAELALAVALALSIDQNRRPTGAMAFAETLHNGLAGVSPHAADATTIRHRGDDTAGTTRLAGGDRNGATEATRLVPSPAPADPTPTARVPARRSDPRQPRQAPDYAPDPYARGQRSRSERGPAPAPYERRQPTYPQSRRRRSGATRALWLLAFACLVVAAVVVAVNLANGTSNTAVHLQHGFSHDFSQAVNQLRSLIGANTKK